MLNNLPATPDNKAGEKGFKIKEKNQSRTWGQNES